MSTKRVAMYLLASVFSVAIHVPNAASQPKDETCDTQATLSELGNKCDDATKRNGIDRTITNSTTEGDDGTDKGFTDAGDHDNGHGNDPDHSDSSNPGKGGGNHGTGNDGNGQNK